MWKEAGFQAHECLVRIRAVHEQLKILGSFYRRDFQKDKVQADELLKDFDQIKKALASGNNTLDQKPYLHFFLADREELIQLSGRHGTHLQ